MAGSTVVVSVLADVKKFTSGMDTAAGGLGKFASAASGMAKVAVGAVAGITAALAGVAIGGGIARALKLDEATTKLKALGYEGERAAQITENALSSVKGTAFGLDSAVNSAVGLLAAGIKPGEQLEGVLSTIANTAALAGTSMDEMGSIFNKVAANGKVTTQEMNQLADRGVPIWQYLGESLGVNNAELREMIEAGTVTADMFNSALGPAVEGIAATMGGSFKGSLQNSMAALSRLGAAWISPALPVATALIQLFTTKVDGLTDSMSPLLDVWKEWTASIDLEAIKGGDLSGLITGLLQLKDTIMGGLMDAFPSLVDGIVGMVPTLVTSVLSGITGLVTAIAAAAPQLIAGGIVLIGGLILGLTEALPQILTAILGIIPILVAGITEGLPQLIEGALLLFQGIVQALSEIVPQLITAVVTLLPVIIDALISGLDALITGAITLFTALVDAIPVVLPLLITAIVELLPQIIAAIIGMIPVLLDGAISLFTALVNSIPVILPLLITAIIELIPVLITTLISAIPALLNGAVQLFIGIVKAIPVIIPALIEAVIKLVPEMVAALIGMIPDLIQAGIDLIGGLIKGLWESAGAVGEALLDIIGGAVDGFLSFLGIASPSRMFKGFGVNLIEGLAQGLADTGLVGKAMTDLQSTVAGTSFDLPAPTISQAEISRTAANTFGGESTRQPVVTFPEMITLRIGNREFEAYIDQLADGRVAAASSAGGARVRQGSDRRF
ncbi:phage tail protein [Leucobacter sp. W1153]|uniref:phage tail protein n=1 Tax=Leucobacter sp. W1153 TaxID=3439064 RepID=UPI003F32134D